MTPGASFPTLPLSAQMATFVILALVIVIFFMLLTRRRR